MQAKDSLHPMRALLRMEDISLLYTTTKDSLKHPTLIGVLVYRVLVDCAQAKDNLEHPMHIR